MDKPEFFGREVWAELAEKEPREKLVMLSIDVTNADAHGGEPIFTKDGTPVGRVSSGAYGHTVEQSLALCFIKTEYVQSGAEFDVAVLGLPHHARLLDKPPFDPEGKKLRA
jgi:dimethylglycine dehydrogenase